MLCCNAGQLRNGSVATQFILLSSTTTSSATGGYVDVPEPSSRNEKPTLRREEQTRSVCSSYLVPAQNLFNELL